MRDKRFVFKDKNEKTEKVTKFHGSDSRTYSGNAKVTREGSTLLPTNDFDSANYALMIFDKKKNAFRLVPIRRHFYFEK